MNNPRLIRCVILLAVSAPLSHSQRAVLPASVQESLVDRVREDLGLEPAEPAALHVYRDISTEESLITLGLDLGPWTERMPPLFRIYKVVEGTYAVENRRIVATSVAMGAAHSWTLAVRDEDGEMYALRGFNTREDPPRDFSDLIDDLDLTVQSTEDAEDVMRFYWLAVLGWSDDRACRTMFQLRSFAALDFSLRCSPLSRASRVFERWWRTIDRALRSSGPLRHAESVDKRFRLTYTYYDWGRVWREVAEVDRAGHIVVLSEDSYGNPSKDADRCGFAF